MKHGLHVIRLAACLTCLSSLFAACGGAPTGSPGDSRAREALSTLTPDDREVVRSDNGFAWKLFGRLAAEEEGNLFISPLSVSIALSMTLNGARGETETAMREVLGHGALDRESVNSLYARLLPALTAADPRVELAIANSIWSSPELDPEPGFIEANRRSFAAEIRSMDFNSPAAAPAINAWVSDKTRGLIGEIVQPPVDPNTVMMLINALYFKGDWARAFDGKKTRDDRFTRADGSEAPCRMMIADAEWLHRSDDRLQAVELPYGDSLFSMVLLQPAAGVDIDSLAASLDAEAWEAVTAGMAPRKGEIHVPRFKLEYEKSLKEILPSLGMAVAFSDAADFTGIHPGGGLKISDVIHKTFVNVDEKGTEAAAVTRVDVVRTSLPAPLLRLDRPFLFAIRERTSGALLFLGRVMEPMQ
jgi:serpin B